MDHTITAQRSKPSGSSHQAASNPAKSEIHSIARLNGLESATR
jgi:hypothetical protein